MYFKKFPTIVYPFEINGVTTAKKVTDITINTRIIKEILQNITAYDEYDIIDGETPEIISERVYGSPLYHWVIMVVNERFNYLEDFPLSSVDLDKYVDSKYGVGERYATHHYVDDNNNIINEHNIDAWGNSQLGTPVTNYDYEATVNESKRRIKLITQENLFKILAQFRSLI